MSVGDKIKETRQKMGITQKELAHRLGTSPQNLAQYESGKRNPKLATICKIASALGVYVCELEPDWGSFTTEEYLAIWEDNEPSESNNESIKESDYLLRSYEKLNDIGKDKVIAYTEDLTKIPEYQKKDK